MANSIGAPIASRRSQGGKVRQVVGISHDVAQNRFRRDGIHRDQHRDGSLQSAAKTDKRRPIQLTDLNQLRASVGPRFDPPVIRQSQMLAQRLTTRIDRQLVVLTSRVARDAGVKQVVIIAGKVGTYRTRLDMFRAEPARPIRFPALTA